MSSFLKHTAHLFLGVSELNRMQKFLDEDGYRLTLLKNSASFGVVRYESDLSFDSFKVVQDVAGSGNYKIESESFAIDSVGRMIRQLPIGDLPVPSDGAWRWVKIKHSYRTIEDGRINIDINGNITGTDTKFLEVLRGAPDFPSKIRFTNSSGNLLEYSIVEVLNDTTALLSGTSFIAETGLTYEIIGTFTPGHVPSSIEKKPFQYDSCEISLVPETVVDTPPVKTDGEEFYIARVMNISGTLQIHDKRIEQYESTAEFNLSNIIKTANPLIGVESIRFSHLTTARDKNIIKLGFGMRTAAWTLDAPNRAITFSTGTLDGGKYKSTSQFSDHELNGWRVYFKDGSYSTIHSSEKQGSAIKCTVGQVDPSKLTTGDILSVVPAVDSVEIRLLSDARAIDIIERVHSFDAADGYGIIDVEVPTQTYSYIIQYRYLKGGEASQWLELPSDTTNGYYDESSFDSNGFLDTTTNKKTYTTSGIAGFIEVERAVDSFTSIIASVRTGDKFCYGDFELDNGLPVKILTTGTDCFIQRCTGVRGGGAMTGNHIIGLAPTPPVSGNSFTLIFNVGIDSAGFSLTINSDYVSAATPGTIIKTFTESDFDFPALTGKALVLKCTYNGASWEVYTIEEDPNKMGDIKMISEYVAADFDSSGKAILGTKHQGWALCNGNNTTLNLSSRFVLGLDLTQPTTPYDSSLTVFSNYGAVGNVGGQMSVILKINEIPRHTHGVQISSSTTGISVNTRNLTDFHASYTQGPGQPKFNKAGGDTSIFNRDISHSHTITDPGHTHLVTENIVGGNDIHENRPNYIVLGFIQRVKQL